jgi:hypothetical protein
MPAYALVIGAYNEARAGSYSIFNLGAAAALQMQLPGTTFVGTPTLTPAFFDQIDVLLFTANLAFSSSISPLTTSERSALLQFVGGGGGVVASTSHYPSFSEPFDVVIDYNSSPLTANSVVPDPNISPVTDGPYGTITSFPMNLFGGVNHFFVDLGAYAEPIAFNGLGQPTLAVIPESKISPGSGRIVLFADPEVGLASVLLQNNGLVPNAIVYVAVPEASTSAMSAGVCVLAMGFVRRKRMAT